MTTNTTRIEFIKVVLSEASDFGGGQAIKVEGESPSFAQFHEDLKDGIRFDPSSHIVKYVDGDGEHIEIADESDWNTCLEEHKLSGPEKVQQGLTIVIIDQINKTQKTSKVHAAKPKPAEITKIETKIQEVSVNEIPQKPTPQETPKPEPQSIAPKIQKEESRPIESKPVSYRFHYTAEEMEEVRKINPQLFSKIEAILADKYEQALIDAERNFKIYHEQQLKHKIIEFQKKFDDLNSHYSKELEKLKKEKDQIAAPRPMPSMFASAMIPTKPIVQQDDSSSRKGSLAEECKTPSKEHFKKYAHFGVGCDVCGQFPLLGIRYKAVGRPNYDLCEVCFTSDKKTDESYIALRESVPEKFNQLVAMARNVEVPNYHKENQALQKLHNWNSDFKDLGSIENRLRIAMDHTFF